MRSLSGILFALFFATAAQASQAALCERLDVPAGIGLICTVDLSTVDGGTTGKVIVKPDGGPFADLSRMSLRRLTSDGDDEAWFAPESWIRSQLTLDFTNIVQALESLAEDPDNPLAGTGFSTVVGAFGQVLADIGNLPLSGCEPVRRNASDTLILGCRWGVDPMALHLEVRLVESLEERYAINIWSMNEKRMRHFSAIANSFSRRPNP